MRVGILYNLVDKVERGRDIDKLADNEVYQTAHAVKEALSKRGHETELVRITPFISKLKEQIDSFQGKYDLIFNLAEGVGSSVIAEPKIVHYLKKAGIPFTGCDAYSLALCMNKIKTKEALVKNNIPTPSYQLFKNHADALNESLKFPLIVKPLHEDGSIGITTDSIANDEQELRERVKNIVEEYKQPAIVEEYIDGREINAAIIGNEKPEALPLSEIIFNFPENIPKIVSFEAKWLEESEQYKGTVGKCPAELPDDVTQSIVETAKKAFKTVRCSDYARVDFRIRDGQLYVLEVNPNPCINPNGAGFIRSANAAGYSYDDIINKIIEVANQRIRK